MRSYRKKLVQLLGPQCVHCGFSDIRALQIDHKNGGGSREIKRDGNINIYLKYLRNPDRAKAELQVLCANCNWIKRSERGEVRKKNDPK